MKKLFFLFIVLAVPRLVFAQKNVVPATQTQMLNLPLPQGSKQDKRMISTGSARMLLEMEAKKESKNITSTEVYYLPPIAESRFNTESLARVLTGSGCQLREAANDNKFTWAEKGLQSFLIYFSMEKSQTELYIGSCSQAAPPMTTSTVSTQDQVVPVKENNPAYVPPLLGRQKNNSQTKIETKEDQNYVYDLDNNRYHVIKFGEQYWLKENLRTI